VTDKQTIKLLKVIMFFGLFLFLLGHYLLSYADLPAKMGVKVIIICAACMAFGLIFSLPTKMYLTFLWVKRENDQTCKNKAQKIDKKNAST
jgi:uncharacterized membrane protein